MYVFNPQICVSYNRLTCPRLHKHYLFNPQICVSYNVMPVRDDAVERCLQSADMRKL